MKSTLLRVWVRPARTRLLAGLLLGGLSGIVAFAQETGAALEVRPVEGIGPCMAVEVAGDRLYATGSGNFHVLDISRPETPKPLGMLSGLGSTRQIVLKDHIAFVAARQDGLWLIDVSDSKSPSIISHYDTVEMATGIWVSGVFAYVATRCYGVEIVDISDPKQPRHVSTLKTGEAQSCWGRDGLLYIGDWAPKKLLVADVKNPHEPVIIGEGLLDGYGDGGCIRGNICFAATGHHSRAVPAEEGQGKGHGLELFDVSDPTSPRFLSRVKFPPIYQLTNDMWTARVSGDYCIVADTWNGLFVVDIHDPARPVTVAHAGLPNPPGSDLNDPVGGIAPGEGVIYAAGIKTGLYVVFAPGFAAPVIPEPDQAPSLPSRTSEQTEDPSFQTFQPGGQVRSVALAGDLAWIACGTAGIQAVQLSDDGMKPVSITRGKGEVFHVAVSGVRLYAAESSGGLGIYGINPDLSLTELGRLTLKNQNIKQVSCPPGSNFALLHWGSAQTLLADVSDPAHPGIVLRDSQVGLFYGDQLVPELLGGRYLVAHWHRSGPAWYDVSGPEPVLAGNTPDSDRLYSWTDGGCAFREKLLIVKRGKLQLLEPGEMRDASTLPAYGIDGTYLQGRPSASGDQVALSRRHERLVQILDVSNLEHPKLAREYSLTGHPGACLFRHGKVLIPAGYQGLLLEK